jgi:hypothetical protein
MYSVLKTNKKKHYKLLGLVILTAGVVAGILLVRQSQDIREKAGNHFEDCTYVGQLCSSITSGCPGHCRKNSVGTLYCSIPASQPNGSCTISGVDCETDVHCLNGRKCQNGKCVGNPNKGTLVKQYIDENKCKTDSDCKSGYFCSILKACISNKWKI